MSGLLARCRRAASVLGGRWFVKGLHIAAAAGVLAMYSSQGIPGASGSGAPPGRTVHRHTNVSLPIMRAPGKGARVLVVAPHTDDEAVGCGGLIAEAVARGAVVHVVYATNGDGFRLAAERAFHETKVSPRDYLRLARIRQQEARRGLAALGVSQSQATFLGYPDRGGEATLLRYWEPREPYTSVYTHSQRNLYSDSLRPGAVYCGRNLLDDLEAAVRRFRPTVVVCPHPGDEHPDHRALYAYTVAALYELGRLRGTRLLLYLVHAGHRWCSLTGHSLDPTVPPERTDAPDTRWRWLPLGPEAAARKRAAIRAHRSQLRVMPRFLLNFARNRELYGAGTALVASGGPLARLTANGRAANWSGLVPVMRDPARDLERPPPADADILALWVARKDRKLFARVDLVGAASSKVEYELQFHVLTGGKVRAPQSYLVQPGRTLPGVEVHCSGASIQMATLWPEEAELDGLLVAAEARRGGRVLDRTARAVVVARHGRL